MININTVENNCAALFVEDVQINDLRETAFQASCAGDAEAATSTGVGGGGSYRSGEGGRGCVPAEQAEVSRQNRVAAVCWDLLLGHELL